MTGVAVVAGTRPEIIKMAPIIRALQKQAVPFTFLHTGQHYEYEMSQGFIEELRLPTPDCCREIRAHGPGHQVSRAINFVERTIRKEKPKIVLVHGDTNTTLGAALAANKHRVPLGHVEAGLRSFDLRMPEEHNRRLVDHISTQLYAPTHNAAQNLRRESVWGDVIVTGNTAIDAVLQYLPIAVEKSRIIDTARFEEYALATFHRAENVDNPRILHNLTKVLVNSPLPIVFPVHPRTNVRLLRCGLLQRLKGSKNVQLLPPIGYLDTLVLLKNSRLVLTDSGGLVEEATAPPIRKRVVVARISTERPEAAKAGFSWIAGTRAGEILTAIDEALFDGHELPLVSPYGTGNAAETIVTRMLRMLSFPGTSVHRYLPRCLGLKNEPS